MILAGGLTSTSRVKTYQCYSCGLKCNVHSSSLCILIINEYFQYKKAAALFTKNGQVRDAAAMYRSMHNYQAAVDLYINNEQYEEAIDELKLYDIEEKVHQIILN